jgi:hypothetical protein
MATTTPYGYATDIHVGSALPNEMNYQLPASLPAAKNFEIRVQPVNAQTFTGGNVLQFDLPCGRRGQYLDPTTTYVRFKVTYTHAGTNGTDYSNLIGSGYSYFNKQECYGNNSVLLESINELGVLANLLLCAQLNDSDRRGLAPALGFESTATFSASSSTVGHYINKSSLNNLTFEYAIPLIGILGSGTNKMFPIGAIYGLRFELTMDNYTNFTLAKGATNKITGCTISEVEFVGNVIELGPEAQALVEMANPERIHIRSQTYRQASNLLASQAGAGTNDLLVGIRVSSLKSIFMSCAPANGYEGKFTGVNPNLDQGTCFVIAGQNYPQRTINPSFHTADTFTELQKCMGALSFNVFNGCLTKGSYYTSSTATGLCQAYLSYSTGNYYEAGAGVPNQFFLGIDTEVVARKDNLLSGINVNSSPMFFRAQINSTLAAQVHTCYFYGYYDVILEVDVAQRNIIAKF